MPASSSNRLALGLAVIAYACVSSVQSLVPETRPPSKPLTATPSKSEPLNRRDLIRALSSTALFNLLLSSQPASALKPNNEALCGTGFFTNIAQYKCTDIGDISDEGQSRKTTAEEESRLDGLMSKFGDLDLSLSSSGDGKSESSRDDSANTGSGKEN